MRKGLRLGVSACLLGAKVRWDAGHKRDEFLVATVGRFVEWVPVCPEQEAGMGVPRPPVRLSSGADGPRMVDPASGRDHTAAMRRFAAGRARALASKDLDGFVLKKDSPSCGSRRVRVHGADGRASRSGVGLFAAALMERLPLLPVEEEDGLADPRRRALFFTRACAYRRLKDVLRQRWRIADLRRFHAAEESLLLAHDPQACRMLARLVAGARSWPRAELAARYAAGFLGALRTGATRRRHVAALRRLQGRMDAGLTARDRAALSARIAGFGSGRAPLSVPVEMLRRLARRRGATGLSGQSYLEPGPMELLPGGQA